MDFLFGGSIFIEGLFARVTYRSLRIMHERALKGTPRAVLGVLIRALSRRTAPQVKAALGQPKWEHRNHRRLHQCTECAPGAATNGEIK